MKAWQPAFETIFDQDINNAEIGNRYLNPAGIFRYRTKTTKSGQMLESEIFPIWNTKAETRVARSMVTRAAQKNLNDRNAARKLVRLVNTNFNRDDLAVTLTYDGEPPDYAQAQKDVRNFIRRVRDYRKREGLPEMKYIYVVEGIAPPEDPEADAQMCLPGLEPPLPPEPDPVRPHHHVILSEMDRDVVERLWGKGWANCRRLQPNEYGLESLSRYMIKERRGRKRWYGSRNLKQPTVTKSDWKMSRRKVAQAVAEIADTPSSIFNRAYPGYELVDVSIRGSEFVSGVYIYARMKRRI